jgi:type VI secretion system protein ImpA
MFRGRTSAAAEGIEVALDEDLRERLLAGIDGGVGVDGREDEGEVGDLFREIRFQRKSIFRAEQKAAMGEEVGGDDAWSWPVLMDVSRDYLADHAKDLEPAAIFLEASVRVDGLVGLAEGTALIADLVETWWEAGLYPPEDEDDGVEARFQPLSGLSGGGSDKDGTLIAPLRRMVVAGDPVAGELRYMDRVVADGQLAAAQTSSQRDTLKADAQAALDEMEAVSRRVPRAQIDRALDRLGEAEAAWRRAVSFISERTKPRFPAASKVSDELRAIRDWLGALAAKLPEAAPEPEAAVDAAAGGGMPAVAGGGMVVQPGVFTMTTIARREDALRAVAAAADFFDTYEPLSPIGSALREVNRRARMSFADLLAELIPDGDTRDTYYWRSGIKPPEVPAEY